MTQIVARQFGKDLTVEEVEKMTFKEKCNWLKHNPVTVARHLDYKYRILKGSTVMMSGMHPIGEILIYVPDAGQRHQIQIVSCPNAFTSSVTNLRINNENLVRK